MSERPLECSECKNPICTKFTQITLNQMDEHVTCKDCPMLAKWYGQIDHSETTDELSQRASNICCGHCGMTMDQVLMGSALGCSDCYDVFADALCTHVLKIPFSNVIHCGRGPGESTSFNPTLRLYALNEALQETLSREEYEEAAKIRDEINSLIKTEENNKDSKPSQEDSHDAST